MKRDETHTLLPCPFCGGAAVLRETVEHYPADEDGPAGSVSCRFEVSCDACGIFQAEEYQDDAIAAWNRRAPAAPAPEGECEYCADGLQADGETPCSACNAAAPAMGAAK